MKGSAFFMGYLKTFQPLPTRKADIDCIVEFISEEGTQAFHLNLDCTCGKGGIADEQCKDKNSTHVSKKRRQM